ncbi:RNA polymerase sigma-70 factor [Chondrinema litorale]|uniref:RNA polymerase sigma-70 factor n=1 Tax=Chondrinema litorale TaxID=2994555 RepID=UPI002543DEF0|nr:RNA polymerase sigma-70 factor [Chondrinema litorale]UZR97574.1 RNA polymerase sigma-70 factor [Chondrinema litorale]
MKNNLNDLSSLLNQVQQKADTKSFKLLFDATYPRLLQFAKYYVKTHFHAQEVVSQVFIKLWENKNELGEVQNVSAYLYTVTKRLSLNYLRDNDLSNTVSLNLLDQNMKTVATNPESELLSAELLSEINKSILSLPPKCQLVYQMVKEDGLKYKDVAQMLDISEKAVEKHMGNAFKKLRKDLDSYFSSHEINKAVYHLSVSVLVLTAFSIFLNFFNS